MYVASSKVQKSFSICEKRKHNTTVAPILYPNCVKTNAILPLPISTSEDYGISLQKSNVLLLKNPPNCTRIL